MADASRRLYDELRALKRRAQDCRRLANRSHSQRAMSDVLRRPPYEVTLSDQRISDWTHVDPARAKVPDAADGGKVVALVRLLSEWAAERPPDEAIWWRWINDAQPARLPSADPTPGTRIDKLTDPFALEVHRPVELDDHPGDLPTLPVYVPRVHDGLLGAVTEAAAAGRSGMAVLVGGSSTGKTRACWEAVHTLPAGWRLWHPYDPSRPEAALAAIERIGPRTVLWLNETQFYLHTADVGTGERLAAALRTLLTDTARAPVLVLGSLWPEHWRTLTDPSADDHAMARHLLDGLAVTITVPDSFGDVDQGPLESAARADPRVAKAVDGAEEGRIAQYLAGVRELSARYRNAPAPARALIHAAMDARRLGHDLALPRPLLAAAAPGYLTELEWDTVGDDWLADGLDYTLALCKGVRGPLSRVRPRGEQDGPVAYRLSDYLDQTGRSARRYELPADTFWSAAVDHAEPATLVVLAQAAKVRGLTRTAVLLLRRAVLLGSSQAVGVLVDSLPTAEVSTWVAAHVGLGDPGVLASLLDRCHKANDSAAAAVLVERITAEPLAVDAGDPGLMSYLLEQLRWTGGREAMTALAARAALLADLRHPRLRWLVMRLREVFERDAHAILVARMVADLVPAAVASVLGPLADIGADDAVATLAARATTGIDASNLYQVAHLLDALHEVGATDRIRELVTRAAACVDRRELRGTDRGNVNLIFALQRSDQQENFTETLAATADPSDVRSVVSVLDDLNEDNPLVPVLAARAAAQAPLTDPDAVSDLLAKLAELDQDKAVAALLARGPAGLVEVTDADSVHRLMDTLTDLDQPDALTVLAGRAAVQVDPTDPAAVSTLLSGFARFDARDATAALLDRRPAATVDCSDPEAVRHLLGSLSRACADDEFAVLAARVRDIDVANPILTARLLETLRAAGDTETIAVLAGRAANDTRLTESNLVDGLLDEMHKAGEHDAITALIVRAATDAPAETVAGLLFWLRERHADHEWAWSALVDGAVNHVDPTDGRGCAHLLKVLRSLHEPDAVRDLARRTAHHADLDDDLGILDLIDALDKVDETEALLTLARRGAAHVDTRLSNVVRVLLAVLDNAGEDVEPLALRAANAGGYASVLEGLPRWGERFPHGREPDGRPSERWDGDFPG